MNFLKQAMVLFAGYAALNGVTKAHAQTDVQKANRDSLQKFFQAQALDLLKKPVQMTPMAQNRDPPMDQRDVYQLKFPELDTKQWAATEDQRDMMRLLDAEQIISKAGKKTYIGYQNPRMIDKVIRTADLAELVKELKETEIVTGKKSKLALDLNNYGQASLLSSDKESDPVLKSRVTTRFLEENSLNMVKGVIKGHETLGHNNNAIHPDQFSAQTSYAAQSSYSEYKADSAGFADEFKNKGNMLTSGLAQAIRKDFQDNAQHYALSVKTYKEQQKNAGSHYDFRSAYKEITEIKKHQDRQQSFDIRPTDDHPSDANRLYYGLIQFELQKELQNGSTPYTKTLQSLLPTKPKN